MTTFGLRKALHGAMQRLSKQTITDVSRSIINGSDKGNRGGNCESDKLDVKAPNQIAPYRLGDLSFYSVSVMKDTLHFNGENRHANSKK